MATLYQADTKLAIVNDAKQLILNGYTLQQIADKHGIHRTSLFAWLQALGEEYEDIRKAWIDGMLAQASDDIEQAGLEQIRAGEVGQAQFYLARARETWKKATWYAERRDTRYSPVQQQATISINLVPPALAQSATSLLDAMYTHAHESNSSGQGQRLDQVEPERVGVDTFVESVAPPVNVGSNMNTSNAPSNSLTDMTNIPPFPPLTHEQE